MTGRPGVPHDENEFQKYLVVPRAHPSRALLYAYLNGSGSREAFSFPGATWDHFRCTVEPCRSFSGSKMGPGHQSAETVTLLDVSNRLLLSVVAT